MVISHYIFELALFLNKMGVTLWINITLSSVAGHAENSDLFPNWERFYQGNAMGHWVMGHRLFLGGGKRWHWVGFHDGDGFP